MKRAAPIITFAALAAALALLAFTRPRFPDEFEYLWAGSLALKGLLPYRDFFFPHPPLSVWLWAPFGAGGTGWLFAARLFLAGLAFAGGVLVYRRSGSVWPLLLLLANSAALVSLTSPDWLVTAGLLFALVVLLTRKQGAFLPGLLFGALVSIRIVFLPLALLRAFYYFRAGRREGALYLAGLSLSLLPLALVVLADPYSFAWDNLLYHLAYKFAPTDIFHYGLQERAVTLLKLLLAPAFPLLVWLSFRAGAKRRGELLLAFELAALFGFHFLVVTPTHFNYHAFFVLPLLAYIAPAARHIITGWKRWAVAGSLVAGLPFTWLAYYSGYGYHELIPLNSMQAATEAINRVAPEGSLVLSDPSDFYYLAGVLPPDAVPLNGYTLAGRLEPELRERLKLIAYEDIGAILERERPAAYVGLNVTPGDSALYRLGELGYVRGFDDGFISVWGREEK